MAENHDVIPPKDSDFDSFQNTFVTEVTANAAAWNIDPAEMALLPVPQTAWRNAYNKYLDKPNRTVTITNKKNLTRKNYETVLRPFIQTQIRDNRFMTDNDRVQCGVKPRDTTRTPAGIPLDVPMVKPEPGDGNSLVIYFKQEPDASGTSRRGRPKNVGRCEIAYQVGGTAPANAEDCNKNTSGSKSPLRITFQASQAGQKVYLFGRWVSTRNEPGGWGIMGSGVIPG